MSRRLRLSRRERDRGGCGRRGDPGDRLSRPRHHDERLDLGRPARLPARQGLRQAVSGPREVQARPGRLGRRRRRRRRRPRDDRQLVARSEGHRSGRHRLQQDRQGRDLHRHQPGQHARRTCRRTTIQAIFSGQVRNWERRPGRRDDRARSTSSSAPRPRARRTRSRRSSWASKTVFSGASREGLQRPRPADRAVRQERDRLRVAGLRQGHQRRRLPGRRAAPCATPSPASTAACATSGWSPAGTRAWPARCRSSSTGSRPRRRPRRSSARTGCRSSRCSTGSREPWPDQRAERMLGALASVVLLLIVADGRLRRRAGVAVVRSTTGCRGSGQAATSTSSSATWSTPARDPPPPTTTLRRVAADLGHAPDDRPRRRLRPGLLGPGRDLHRRVRPGAAAARDRAGGAPAGRGAVGHLRPDRDPRAGPVRQRPPRSREARKKSVAVRHPALGHGPARRRS